jgi:hypothetical protein
VIKPPSLQRPFTLIFSGDPALELPTDEKERAKALEVARDTGNWSALLKVGGEPPTLFEIIPMTATAKHWLGQLQLEQGITQIQICALAFRLSIKKIESFGDFKLRFEERSLDSGDKITLATADVIDELGKLGPAGESIMIEIGTLALLRAAQGVPPKS